MWLLFGFVNTWFGIVYQFWTIIIITVPLSVVSADFTHDTQGCFNLFKQERTNTNKPMKQESWKKSEWSQEQESLLETMGQLREPGQ